MARIVLAFLSKPRNMLSRSMRNWDSTSSASHFSTRISFTTQWKNLRPIGEVKFEHEAICAGRCRPGWAIRSHPQVFRLLGVITVEHVIQLHIERLPEGGYLATSDAVQGLEHFSIRLGVARVCEISFAFFFGNPFEKRGDCSPKLLNSARLHFA